MLFSCAYTDHNLALPSQRCPLPTLFDSAPNAFLTSDFFCYLFCLFCLHTYFDTLSATALLSEKHTKDFVPSLLLQSEVGAADFDGLASLHSSYSLLLKTSGQTLHMMIYERLSSL